MRRWVRALLGAVLVAAALATVAPAPAVAATVFPWPKVRFDAANTAYNPTETSLSRSNVASLAQDWAVPASRYSSVIYGGGVLYTGCDGGSYCALDSTNGQVRWKTPVGDNVGPDPAVLEGGVVYLGASRPPTMYALDATTGAILWQTMVSNTPTEFDSKTVVAGGLVIKGLSGHLFAWDARTGVQRWVVELGTRGAPAVANGVLYVYGGGQWPALHAVRAATGETLWRTDSMVGYLGRSPMVAGGLVVVGGQQGYFDPGQLVAYPAAGCGAPTCRPVWTFSDLRSPTGDAAAAYGVVYQGLASGHLAAVHGAVGQLLWKGVTDGASQPVQGSVGHATVANGLVFASGGDGLLYAWAADGCGAASCPPLWKAPVGAGSWMTSDVVVAGGRVFVADDLGVLRAFSPRVDPSPPVTPPPVVPPPKPPVRTTPTTIHVPADHLTIQRAIDASIDGDTVVVAPGLYHDRLDFNGRAVEVRSSGGPEVTTITGDGISTVVVFESEETRASVLRGFTITGGNGSVGGGAINAPRSSPSIIGNIVTGNYGSSAIDAYNGGTPLIQGNHIHHNYPTWSGSNASGGAISVAGLGSEILWNTIEDNVASGDGGGLAINGPTLVAENVVRRNTSGGDGGGVSVYPGGGVVLRQNLIADNHAAGAGGGIHMSTGSGTGPWLVHNTIANNRADGGASAVYARLSYGSSALVGNVVTGSPGTPLVVCDHTYADVVPSFSHNDIYSGDAGPVVGCGDPGGLSLDPAYVNPAAGDYRLRPGSPAVDAGDSTEAGLPAVDLAGAPRVVDGDGDGARAVDIGTYELQRPAADVAAGLTFHPLAPARVLDTRNGTGGISSPIGPGATASVTVAGRGGVPATGAAAVVLNVTVTQPTAGGYLTVFPAGTTRPLASSLNFAAGQTVGNLVVAKVGSDGRVAIFNSTGTAAVVADVLGWFGDDGGGARFTPLAPARILDTRAATPVGADSSLRVTVAGRGGVPPAGATAVVLNVTATRPSAGGYLTVFPAGTPRPLASNLNIGPGETAANLVMVAVGAGGSVDVYNRSGTTDVVVDVVGWYGDTGDRFTATAPARILDTRTTAAPVGPGATTAVSVAGRGPVPATGVDAVVLNVTATGATAGGYLTLFPAGTARPTASSLNFGPGQTRANLVVAKVGADGKVAVYNNSGTTHVVLDVVGWFPA